MPDLLVNAGPARVGSRPHHGPITFCTGDALRPRPSWRPRQPRSRRRLPPRGRAAPSRPSENRLPPSLGGLASVLFHGALLILGASLVVRSAHLEVITGKASTEMILMAPPAVSAIPLAPPLHVTTSPPPAPRAQPILPPIVAVPKRQPASPPIPIARSTAVSVVQPHSPAPVPHTVVSFSSRGAVEARPDELNNQPPVYPEDSRVAREEGVVMLRAAVSSTGEASHVAIQRSSGYFRLDQAARDAVRAWRFHPALLGGTAVSSEVDVPVRFELR